jgi:hypothetical protein
MKLDLEVYTDLTQTRMRLCPVMDCKFNLMHIGKAECNLKFIELDESGRCRQFIPKLARD